MAKKTKSFFVPTRTEGWYRAIPDAQAATLVAEHKTADTPLYHVAGPVRGSLGHPLAGHDNYNLIHTVASSSQSARHELASALVDQIAQNPALRDEFLSQAAGMLNDASDDLWDSLEFHGDTERPLVAADTTEDPAASQAERDLATALARADLARERAFDEGRQFHFGSTQQLRREIQVIDEGKPLVEALRQYVADGSENGAQAAAEGLREAMVTKVTPNLLVRSLDTVPVHYGGPDNGFDGPSRAETKMSISAVDLAMRHWDEVTARKPTSAGISVGNGRFRAIPAAIVEAQGVRITGPADLAAVRSTPKVQPAPPAQARKL